MHKPSRAARRLNAEPAEVAGRVHLVQARGEQASELLGQGRYDAVLCHGVLMYLEDPEPLVSSVCGLARPGGIVSIVTKNARTLALRPGRRG